MSDNPYAVVRRFVKLGPLGGTSDYRQQLIVSRARIWSQLLGRKKTEPLRVVFTGQCGATNVDYGYIQVPPGDPENVLVMEHELSHHAFLSNHALQNASVERALQGYQSMCRVALAGKDTSRLRAFLGGLYNTLEDIRVRSLWCTLYPHSGQLLQDRWCNILDSVGALRVKTEMLLAVQCMAFGREMPPRSPALYAKIAPLVRSAAERCEHTDALATAAIFLELSRRLREALNSLHTDPPPNATGGGGGSQGDDEDEDEEGSQAGGSTGGATEEDGGSPPQPPSPATGPGPLEQSPGSQGQPPPKTRPDPITGADSTRQVLDLLHMVGRPPQGSPDMPQGGAGESSFMGSPSPQDVSKAETQVALLQRAGVQYVRIAHTPGEVMEPTPTIDDLVTLGTSRMAEKLEEYRAALSQASAGAEESSAFTQRWVTVASSAENVQVHIVSPSTSLPTHSDAGSKIRQTLRKIRMSKRRVPSWEGDDLDMPAVVDAVADGDLDRPLFTEKKTHGGMDLLVLCDVSGSMSGEHLRAALAQAVADIVWAVRDLPRVKAHLWCFSDDVFIFTRPGGFATDVQWSCTNMVQALGIASAWARVQTKKRAILMITDGSPTSVRAHHSTGKPEEDMACLVRELRQQRVVVDAVLVGSVPGCMTRVFKTESVKDYALVGPAIVAAAERILRAAV